MRRSSSGISIAARMHSLRSTRPVGPVGQPFHRHGRVTKVDDAAGTLVMEDGLTVGRVSGVLKGGVVEGGRVRVNGIMLADGTALGLQIDAHSRLTAAPSDPGLPAPPRRPGPARRPGGSRPVDDACA
jgi:hypothetical protein